MFWRLEHDHAPSSKMGRAMPALPLKTSREFYQKIRESYLVHFKHEQSQKRLEQRGAWLIEKYILLFNQNTYLHGDVSSVSLWSIVKFGGVHSFLESPGIISQWGFIFNNGNIEWRQALNKLLTYMCLLMFPKLTPSAIVDGFQLFQHVHSCKHCA